MSDHKSDKSHSDVERAATPSSDDHDSHLGVLTVEATHKVYGKYSKCLGLAAYIYSLDGTTTHNYLAFAASFFGNHSLISTIQVAQAVIIAVGKPVIAKIADVGSRGSAYVFVLIFYVVGYIVIASANNIQSVGGGIVVYAVGYTGLQLLTQIIIADITTLKWRGLVSALMSMPFIINAFVGSNIATDIIQGAGWRWGYGMFAILVPAALSPLIITLLWAEWKARKLGIVKQRNSTKSFRHKFFSTVDKLDVVGLVLLGTAVALILLPLTLSRSARSGWKNPSIIAMLVVGIVLLPVYLFWDIKFAKHPVVPRRFLLNRSVVIAADFSNSS
ncbi:hypothetical protein NLJ89_g10896 [Agrocybe chaxingu]|uniref:Major facilitator superfamily (MFS) profile domain-containing protein n=1 Tax=Agrocybe chaxingu TaxID=84603 RepID=A0A9W8JQD4_9AGAR|nr:hypothetical protein NLJ89_g10896 [Agrocybe chaxingu]